MSIGLVASRHLRLISRGGQLSSDKQSLIDEVERLKQQLQPKKKARQLAKTATPSRTPITRRKTSPRSRQTQDIKVKPRNICFLRSVFYSPKQNKYFRGPLPSGYDQGDFVADLRALILSLEYCGNMSEPKICEFLENFDVQISSGSVSNILTKTADSFAEEFDEIVQAIQAAVASG